MNYCPQCRETLVRRQHEGIERLCCPACSFVHWLNPTPVVLGLVRRGSHFILARNRVWPEGRFSLIAGYMEAGETPEQTLRRETREELGVEATDLAFIGHYAQVERNFLVIAYVVDITAPVQLGEELIEAMEIKREHLASYDFSPFTLTARIVAEALAAGLA